MSVAARAGLFVAVAALLSACATREPRPEGAWLAEREAWFTAHPNWQLTGRVGLSDGRRAGSMGFSWEAEGDTHHIQLRTAAGGRQWRLSFSPRGAELEGSEVDRLTGPDPDPLVERAVGWPIPVEALSWWIRGLVPPGGGAPRFSEDGTLAGVSGPVWTLDYQHFESVDDRLLPVRLEANSGDYRVRIFVGEWRFGFEAE